MNKMGLLKFLGIVEDVDILPVRNSIQTNERLTELGFIGVDKVDKVDSGVKVWFQKEREAKKKKIIKKVVVVDDDIKRGRYLKNLFEGYARIEAKRLNYGRSKLVPSRRPIHSNVNDIERKLSVIHMGDLICDINKPGQVSEFVKDLGTYRGEIKSVVEILNSNTKNES